MQKRFLDCHSIHRSLVDLDRCGISAGQAGAVEGETVEGAKDGDGDQAGLEIALGEGLEFCVGDEVIARRPDRSLHPEGERGKYVRNGSRGRVVAAVTVHFPVATVARPIVAVTTTVGMAQSRAALTAQGAAQQPDGRAKSK